MFTALKAALAETSTVGAVSISNQNINALGFGTQTVSYQILTAGTVRRIVNGTTTTLETWLNSGSASDYQVRVTDGGPDGITSGDATGTWLTLNTNYSWTLEETVSGNTSQTVLTVEIRDVATSTVQDTATVTLTASPF